MSAPGFGPHPRLSGDVRYRGGAYRRAGYPLGYPATDCMRCACCSGSQAVEGAGLQRKALGALAQVVEDRQPGFGLGANPRDDVVDQLDVGGCARQYREGVGKRWVAQIQLDNDTRMPPA
jgi:hypothetical protein